MNSAIIVAGGKGKRMGSNINKQYLRVGDREIISLTLDVFEKCELIDEIIVVINKDDIQLFNSAILANYSFTKVTSVVPGGTERQNSVWNGLQKISPQSEIVLIHDGARPFVNDDIISNTIQAAKENGSATVAVPVKDTIKVSSENSISASTLDRSKLWAIQTPQAFKKTIIIEAHTKCREKSFLGTDDTSLTEFIGIPTKLVMGNYTNIKITTPEDLIFAQAIINNCKK